VKFTAIVLVLCLIIVQAALAPAHAAATNTFSIQHHQITTTSAAAQSAFDEGLTLLYAFNRAASYKAFEQAAKADPHCAMCWWGMAIAQGSNVNTTADAQSQKAAYDDEKDAQSLEAYASDEEKAYIEALASRYSADPQRDLHQLALAYHSAMAVLVAKYPADDDAATLFAESGLDLHPWRWFTSEGQPVEGTEEVIATLETVLRRDPMHIGANHFYIHAVEESRQPERALVSAARLDSMTFEDAAAHLVHMPAHIYMRTGNFDKATRANERASLHDRAYMHMFPDDSEASGYHNHNLNMLVSGYEMEGDSADATRVAKQLEAQNDMLPVIYEALRFKRWDVLLAMQKPGGDALNQLHPVIWHFGRGMALVSQGRLSEAQAERDIVQAAASSVHAIAHEGSNNSSVNLIHIARDVLDAAIARARGNSAKEIAALQSAAATQDQLVYTEPPDWYFPVREALGGALLRQSKNAQAEKVFRDDLARNPKNPRSLFGLAAALKAQSKNAEAQTVSLQFDDAWKHADTKLTVADL
jgi:Tfp pilus assembly protein PilF